MNEQVAKAMQTLKAYCREANCFECSVHSAGDQICWLQGRPIEWQFVVDDFRDTEDINESKAAQTLIDYCKQTVKGVRCIYRLTSEIRYALWLFESQKTGSMLRCQNDLYNS